MRTALIVDDEPMMVRLCASILEGMDFQVLKAYCAEEALALLTGNPAIDLLLTDIRMEPGMDGVELANRSRATYPDLDIIIMSGFAEQESVKRMLAGSGNRFKFLHKPFTVTSLRNAVQVRKES